MRLSVLVSATIAVIIANASATEATKPVGWCEWLPWTCETHRTPSRWNAMKERIECRMRRIRYCCNSDPPVSATSCPGPRTTGRRRRDRGGVHWARRGGFYRRMECPGNRKTNYGIFFTSLKVNACATKYPKPDASHTTVWCPWEYWSTWNYTNRSAANRLCKRVRTRNRRCFCTSRSWFGFGETSCTSSRAYTDKQEQSVNCSIPEYFPTHASPEVIIDYYPHSPVPIVLVCLALLVVLVVAVTIGIICAARCKKKRAAASASAAVAASSTDRSTSFASRLASSFRRGAGIAAPAPSAPAYGSAAFYNAGVPVPTVSLKVSDGREGLQEGPPPPYSSQPELPRGTVGGPSGSSQQPPPPYSQQPHGATWDSPPVEP